MTRACVSLWQPDTRSGTLARLVRLATAAILVGFLSGWAAPRAEAQLVTRNGTTIFQTGYEFDEVGGSPTTPAVGTWTEVESDDPARIGVYGPASGGPGAFDGDNYLRVFRPDDPSNAYLLGAPTGSIVDGDALHLEAWVWIDLPAGDYNFFMGFESADLATRLWVAASSTSNGSGGYRLLIAQGGAQTDLADLAFVPQQWHKWTMDYVVGASEVTIGIDDALQTRMNIDPGDTTANPFTEFRITSSNWPTTFYIDGPQDAAIPGDVNFDGFVDIFDVNLVSAHWSETGPTADANHDGIVDIFDINLISSNWAPPPPPGGGAAVPEPASFLLLAVGAALGLWRLRVR